VQIYKLLKEQGLTQSKAAKLLGTTQAQVSTLMCCRPVSVSARFDSIGITINGQKTIRTVLPDITERKRAEERREKLVLELKDALAQIKTLRGILNICSYCYRIRSDDGKWEQMELYIRDRSETQFSHGMCPQCLAKHYPEYQPENK
jgi:predicted transcriptional regulator